MDVSIIIVNYKTKDLIKNCINSIYKHTKDVDFEIIVSDNGSVDGSVEMIKSEFPNVILIENNANLGFGAANNRGLKIAKGKYIFYLNSDTILLNNAIKIFFDYFESHERENIGALGCNLLDSNNFFSSSYALFPSIKENLYNSFKLNYGLWKLFIRNKVFRKSIPLNSKNQKKYNKFIGNVDFIIGADLFVKNNKYAFFDEKFFLYYEETDLQFNMYKNNLQRIIIDGPLIIHYEGQSSKDTLKNYFDDITSFSSVWKNISRIYYFKKNISKPLAFILKCLVLLIWLNPMIIKHNYKYIPKLLKA